MNSLRLSRAHFVKILLVCLALKPALAASDSPNIVLILLDDFGWNGLSVPMDDQISESKSDYYRTPNLDTIATSGLRFAQGYASSPICGPTRYAIQFGQSPTKLGRVSNYKHETEKIDHESLWSIPKALKAANPKYVAAHFGKWHIAAMPSAIGYDESDGLTGNDEGFFTSGELEHQRKYIMEDAKLSYSLSHRAADFMERQTKAGSPFFLQVSYYANHTNVACTPREYERFRSIKPGKVHADVHFAAMTADLDNGVGIIVDRLKELGAYEDTYIIVVADNGAIPGFPPKPEVAASFNYPLTMGKWNVHEGGVRVPFFIRGPGIRKESFNRTPVVTHDLLPTIAALGGHKDVNFEGVEGVDLTQIISGSVTELERVLVFNFPLQTNWEMHDATTSIRKEQYKMIKYLETGQMKLFDLENDLAEEHDLARGMPEKVSELEEELNLYFRRIGRSNDLISR